MSDIPANLEPVQFSSRKKRVRKRVYLFSLGCALVALLLCASVFYVFEIYFPLTNMVEKNHKTFERVVCDPAACDTSAISNDWEFIESDYLFDRDNYFALSFDTGFKPVTPGLQFSDSAFIMHFETPNTFTTPAKEIWRLHAGERQFGKRRVVVMVGYAMKASWKLDLPPGPINMIDQRLRVQLERIMGALQDNGGEIQLPRASLTKITADGYEVVDRDTNELLHGGFQIPIYFPKNRALPSDGTRLARDGYELHLVRADSTDRLLAVSTYPVSDLVMLVSLFALVFLCIGGAAYIVATTFLRKYFATSQPQIPTIDQALKQGEGKTVEFKRHFGLESPVSADQILQTVAAFANADGGVIFIGIDDDGKIKGLMFDGSKAKDQFSLRLYDVVRSHIRPALPIRVEFEDIRGLTVCKVVVPRGMARVYVLDGVVYFRYGSSDIKASPELIEKMFADFDA